MAEQRISEEEVRKVARLSRLKLSDREIAHFREQLADVLGYFQKMNELDVDGVEPMAHGTELRNKFREDEPTEPLGVEEVLKNAPAAHPPFFKVPKVLGDASSA